MHLKYSNCLGEQYMDFTTSLPKGLLIYLWIYLFILNNEQLSFPKIPNKKYCSEKIILPH